MGVTLLSTRGWFTLAEQVAWLDGERARGDQNDKKE
jgi:hypothetical protein